MDTARRDRWGRYLVRPPDDTKPVGYTRATTVAKVLDDGGGLMPWKAAMAMTGMMRRTGLRGRFEALLSAHPDTGPWYGGDDAKKAVKTLVEECAEAGGSSDRADIGTALHAIVEQINRGEQPSISQDSTRADIAAYQATLARYGITFDAELVEATVVLDAYQVAGTADGGIVHIPGLGDVIADLKTGASLDYSGQAIAVQLAIYANGDAHYRQGLNDDGSADVRLPAPDVRKDIAVVIHLPAGEARCDLYTVDIAAGWEAFEASLWARDWRKRKDLLAPLALELVAPVVEVPAPADDLSTMVDASRQVLLELVLALPAERQTVLKDSWPKGWPKLKKADGWTPTLLVEATAMIATAASAPAPNGQVATGAALSPDGQAALSEAAAEPSGDPPATTAELQRLRDSIVALPAGLQRWVDREGVAAGISHFEHPEKWTTEHVATLDTIIDVARELAELPESEWPPVAPYDWKQLVETVGVTKASVQRYGKELAGELGVKVPAIIERYPDSGEFADRLAQWLHGQRAALDKAAVA